MPGFSVAVQPKKAVCPSIMFGLRKYGVKYPNPFVPGTGSPVRASNWKPLLKSAQTPWLFVSVTPGPEKSAMTATRPSLAMEKS